MLDRIDMIVEVRAVPYEALRDREVKESSADVKKRIDAVRKLQAKRFGNEPMTNGRMGPKELRQFCQMDDDAAFLIENSFKRLGLTARSYDRILKVARTIADLAGNEIISMDNIAEAIQFHKTKFGD